MRHRDNDRMVDAFSRSSFLAVMGGPRHRASPEVGTATAVMNEIFAYERWCRDRQLDPEDTSSAVAYEGEVGWLYLDDEPRPGMDDALSELQP